MTTPFWCLIVLVILPYVLAGAGGYFKTRQFGVLDNNHPRLQAAKLEGIGARAWAAQANAWEALAVFSVAVFLAHLRGVDPAAVSTPALIYTGTRILHPLLYLLDQATARTGVFVVGLLCLAQIFRLAIAG